MSTYQDECEIIPARREILTVGELLEALADVDPSTEIDIGIDCPEADWTRGGVIKSQAFRKHKLNSVTLNPMGGAVNLFYLSGVTLGDRIQDSL